MLQRKYFEVLYSTWHYGIKGAHLTLFLEKNGQYGICQQAKTLASVWAPTCRVVVDDRAEINSRSKVSRVTVELFILGSSEVKRIQNPPPWQDSDLAIFILFYFYFVRFIFLFFFYCLCVKKKKTKSVQHLAQLTCCTEIYIVIDGVFVFCFFLFFAAKM